MWNTMKQKKRCIVVCQGFYEWLKKNGGKEKVPHFVKRKDDQLMCLAGLWDCAQYEGKVCPLREEHHALKTGCRRRRKAIHIYHHHNVLE